MTTNSPHAKTVLVGFVLAALALPSAAQAAPVGGDAGAPYSVSGSSPSEQPQLVSAASDAGFRLSDAVLGASIVIAMAIIVVAFVLAIRAHRADRTRFRLTSTG